MNRRRRPPRSPSRRKPEISFQNNHADLIERQLEEDGHRTWGFVIYRTTYGNDDEWQEFLARLRYRMEQHFEWCNGLDVLGLFTLLVIEDPEQLDGASTATVRQRFREWRETAPQLEQREGDEDGREIGPGLSPRYRFAIQVDADSLRSVVHDAPAPPDEDATKRGWVKLIDASWEPATDERFLNAFDPIEGVTEKDVGWMKIPYKNVDEYYVRTRDRNYWPTSYLRPPTIMGWPYTD
ncbi:hypothetical protein K432DRAFT_310820 [Lepidopterella palustris CBS 459.81]|uniref:Uncharacterized protein n=1 Tax=Lepidopterella palustris CBS 459.81 TaxID=1314670 RepID=A0A8E2DZD8_9PEZI|nr:hypothetical protein K432DRAFT_310820 [Lepidopterella palustris CBS 459.81]